MHAGRIRADTDAIREPKSDSDSEPDANANSVADLRSRLTS